MQPQRTLLVATALLAALGAGCLGSVTPGEIPQESLDENDWRMSGESQTDVAGGLATRIDKEYRPNGGGTASLSSGVLVVSANDVPLLDERRFIGDAIEKVEERQGVSFENPSTRSVQLSNLGGASDATEYDVQGAPVPGKALIFTADPCDSFVVVVAWGATGSGGGGILGGGGDSREYENAVTVARTVVC